MFLPFLGLLFAAAIDYCRIYYFTQTIHNAAQAAALHAAGYADRHPDKSMEDAVRAAALRECADLKPALNPDNVRLEYATGNAVVTVRYEMPTLTRLVGVSGTIAIQSSVHVPLMPKPG